MTVIVPARKVWGRQPNNLIQLKDQYVEKCAFAFNFNSLTVKDLRPGTNVTLTPVNPALVYDCDAVGVKATASRAYLDTYNFPLATSSNDGLGDFTITGSLKDSASASVGFAFNIRLNSGNFNQLLVISNGYYVNNATTVTAQSGTFYVGEFDVLTNARGIAVTNVIKGRILNFAYSRKGTTRTLYINGSLIGTYTSANSSIAAAGQLFSVGGAGTATTVPFVGKLHALYAANYALPDNDLAAISNNPWQIFAPRRQLLYVSATSVQLSYLRPASDITTGSWSPSTSTTLYGVLDEVVPDDADYIQASTATGCEIKLSAGSTPTSRDNHAIKYRLLAGSGNIAVVLKCGSTTIKSWNHTLTGSAQDFSQALSNAEATTITDYSDLRVRFET